MYSVGHVAAKVMQETGTNASFVKSMKDAKAAEGIKGAPLVVKAVRAGDKNSGVVISSKDASHFGKNDINYTFLRNAQVIVVID